MVVEIMLDGKVVSTRTIASDSASDPRLLKRLALAAALAAGDVALGDALRVTFRIPDDPALRS